MGRTRGIRKPGHYTLSNLLLYVIRSRCHISCPTVPGVRRPRCAVRPLSHLNSQRALQRMLTGSSPPAGQVTGLQTTVSVPVLLPLLPTRTAVAQMKCRHHFQGPVLPEVLLKALGVGGSRGRLCSFTSAFQSQAQQTLSTVLPARGARTFSQNPFLPSLCVRNVAEKVMTH